MGPIEADSAAGDVLTASATHDNGCRIDIYFNSGMPLAEQDIAAFANVFLAEFSAGVKIDAHQVFERNGTPLFFATFMSKGEAIAYLFRSFWGSPMRAEYICPANIDPLTARDQLTSLIEKFSRPAEEEPVVDAQHPARAKP